MAEVLEQQTLIIAATRPAVMPFVGLPHGVAVIFFFVAMETIIVSGNVFDILFLVPVWAVLYAFVKHDWNAMRLLGLWCRTAALSVDVWRWCGGSLSPWPVRSRAPRGIAG
jgi:type IV secretory pathway VirB3-like protein